MAQGRCSDALVPPPSTSAACPIHCLPDSLIADILRRAQTSPDPRTATTATNNSPTALLSVALNHALVCARWLRVSCLMRDALRIPSGIALRPRDISRQLSPFPHVQSLTLHKGSAAPINDRLLAAIAARLPQLTELCLVGLPSLPPSLARLSSLQRLDLRDMDGLKLLPDDFGRSLPRLRDLTIHNSADLRRLPRSFPRLPSLQRLRLSLCHSLTALPDGSDTRGESCDHDDMAIQPRRQPLRPQNQLPLPSHGGSYLRESKMGRHEGSTGRGRIHEEEDGSHGRQAEVYLPQLLHLELVDMFYLQNPVPRGLVDPCRPSTIRRLVLQGSARSLPSNIFHLPDLRWLELRDQPNLEHLSPDLSCLTSLEILVISSCPILYSLPSELSWLRCLKELWLQDLPMFSRLPSNFCFLPSLERFVMERCGKIEYLPEGFEQLPRLRELALVENSMLWNVEFLGGLSSLEVLILHGPAHYNIEVIAHSPRLRVLSTNSRLAPGILMLSSLEELELVNHHFDVEDSICLALAHNNCSPAIIKLTFRDGIGSQDSTVKFPLWMRCLLSLERLVLTNIQNMVVLPTGLQNLPRLHTVEVCRCSGLDGHYDNKFNRLDIPANGVSYETASIVSAPETPFNPSIHRMGLQCGDLSGGI